MSEDEFESYLAEQLKNPTFRNAYEDAGQREYVLDALVVCRREHGITQQQVAERMGVKQPSVSELETASDPRLSTLQRYARAVGCRLAIQLVPSVSAPKETT